MDDEILNLNIQIGDLVFLLGNLEQELPDVRDIKDKEDKEEALDRLRRIEEKLEVVVSDFVDLRDDFEYD